MSPRGQIRDALSSKGEKAAWEIGRKLGIKDATIKAYISHFQKLPTGRVVAKGNNLDQLPKLKPISSAFSDKLGKGVLVFDIGDPRTVGTIKEMGPEVSGVQFPHGYRFTSNAYLQPVEEDKKKRAKQIDHWVSQMTESRVVRMKAWIKANKKPNDKEIWAHIKTMWPSLCREDRERVFHEC